MLEPGLEGTIEETVTREMTATALESGDVPVLGTPAILALAERAARAAVDGRLDPGRTTVGSRVDLEHLAPTPIAATITATVRLLEVDGRTLTFEVEVRDPGGTVARGTHRRVVVDRERFLAGAARRISG
jgi:fluoroacetyl-CoA thioesterase